MPLFPSFRRPCPYQAELSAVMDGDWCRVCGQQVHDITDLSDAERAALLRRCDGDICVSYRVPVASVLAAAALVASGASAKAPSRGAHHPAPKVAQIQPPVITLAGAPMPLQPAPAGQRPETDATPAATQTKDASPVAGPQSSR
ncbi:hypothetical protein [Sphingomonas sp.]|uniref:hypothetical protein n=1 Tax=Sphingomonas sp. TaxID=28214 RepID=UPI003CC59E56